MHISINLTSRNRVVNEQVLQSRPMGLVHCYQSEPNTVAAYRF